MKEALSQLIVGEIPYILVDQDALPDHPVLLPGSFNPLHQGHVELLCAAAPPIFILAMPPARQGRIGTPLGPEVGRAVVTSAD